MPKKSRIETKRLISFLYGDWGEGGGAKLHYGRKDFWEEGKIIRIMLQQLSDLKRFYAYLF